MRVQSRDIYFHHVILWECWWIACGCVN